MKFERRNTIFNTENNISYDYKLLEVDEFIEKSNFYYNDKLYKIEDITFEYKNTLVSVKIKTAEHVFQEILRYNIAPAKEQKTKYKLVYTKSLRINNKVPPIYETGADFLKDLVLNIENTKKRYEHRKKEFLAAEARYKETLKHLESNYILELVGETHPEEFI
jgi:hypothetical protein